MVDGHTLRIFRSCSPVVDKTSTSDQPITETVIAALAEAKGVDPTELAPLYDVIDPDVFAKLSDRTSDDGTDTILSFTYGTWNVFIRGDGKVRICDGTQDTAPTSVFEDSSS